MVLGPGRYPCVLFLRNAKYMIEVFFPDILASATYQENDWLIMNRLVLYSPDNKLQSLLASALKSEYEVVLIRRVAKLDAFCADCR
jgi:hypothetical protein